jgi:hypothetical protein
MLFNVDRGAPVAGRQGFFYKRFVAIANFAGENAGENRF